MQGTLADLGPDEVHFAEVFLDWCHTNGLIVEGAIGSAAQSIRIYVPADGTRVHAGAISCDGSFYIGLREAAETNVFGHDDDLEELVARYNRIDGFKILEDERRGSPGLPIHILRAGSNSLIFIRTFRFHVRALADYYRNPANG